MTVHLHLVPSFSVHKLFIVNKNKNDTNVFVIIVAPIFSLKSEIDRLPTL